MGWPDAGADTRCMIAARAEDTPASGKSTPRLATPERTVGADAGAGANAAGAGAGASAGASAGAGAGA
eukprot:260870-Pleurochrysis_carterae.AAC.1